MLVLAIRIAYNKLIKKYMNLSIPMIIDSPAANEFDEKSILEINHLLNSIDNQVIIFTLKNTEIKVNAAKVYEIKNRLLNKAELIEEEENE